ncbi:MAG: DeoR/GlpR family DNA-binding transcription regulator [Caldilinea sp.]
MHQTNSLRRQERLLEILAQNGEASVDDLAKRLQVSVWTIRRDLSSLEARGALRRTYGRAEVTNSAIVASVWDGAAVRQAAATNLEAKQRIGRAVAQRLPGGAHLALSGGSTTLQVARALKALHYQGEVLTNALDIAMELADMPGLRVVCTGGDVQPRYHTLAGAVTERVLKLHFFDYAVIGVSGIDPHHGFTVNSQVEAATVNLIAEHARTVIVVADQTKFGSIAFAAVLGEAPPHKLVTDSMVAPAFAEFCRRLGIELMVV